MPVPTRRVTLQTVNDLEKTDIRIGCVQVGGAVDVVLHRMMDKYGLDEDKVLNHVQRMNPPKQVMASLGDAFKKIGDYSFKLKQSGLTAPDLAALAEENL